MIIASRSTAAWLAAGVFAAATPAHARKMTVVTLGDSTTAGTPFFRSPLEAPPNGAGDVEGYYGYWIAKKHPEWTVLNFGVAGQTSADIRDRLDAALAANPRYVIVLAGVNDVFRGIDLNLTAVNLAGMYREIQRRNIVPIAATVLPTNAATPRQAAQIRQLNTWIKSTSDKLLIPYLDLNRVVADTANPDHLNGSPDEVHPDEGGYRAMGMAATQALEKLEASR